MSVSQTRLLAAVSFLLMPVVAARGSAQQSGESRSAALDVHVFAQGDEGGNPYMREAFQYYGVRFAVTLPPRRRLGMRANSAFAVLSNDPPQAIPATVQNATTTSSSPTQNIFDVSVLVDAVLGKGKWTVSPGVYYHNQEDFGAAGGDLGFSGELSGGDTVLTFNYSFRAAFRKVVYWDSSHRGRDNQWTHNLLIGWTQTLSPDWILGLSAQFTRQDGLLIEPYNYVTLLDDRGVPVRLADEILPRRRNRGQLNARTRWSPRVGVSLGLDASVYLDDWLIYHGAIEPNVSFPLPSPVRWRLWYRFSMQRATRYFQKSPTAEHRYQTQDSDLATFLMHSPGLSVFILLHEGRTAAWHLNLAVFGFYRDDGVMAGGVTAGTESRF